jgi:hypothetical protein
MDPDDKRNKKEVRNSKSGNSEFSKSIWVRPTRIQVDSVNEQLLAYNVYTLLFYGPILYLILYFV